VKFSLFDDVDINPVLRGAAAAALDIRVVETRRRDALGGNRVGPAAVLRRLGSHHFSAGRIQHNHAAQAVLLADVDVHHTGCGGLEPVVIADAVLTVGSVVLGGRGVNDHPAGHGADHAALLEICRTAALTGIRNPGSQNVIKFEIAGKFGHVTKQINYSIPN